MDPLSTTGTGLAVKSGVMADLTFRIHPRPIRKATNQGAGEIGRGEREGREGEKGREERKGRRIEMGVEQGEG